MTPDNCPNCAKKDEVLNYLSAEIGKVAHGEQMDAMDLLVCIERALSAPQAVLTKPEGERTVEELKPSEESAAWGIVDRNLDPVEWFRQHISW